MLIYTQLKLVVSLNVKVKFCFQTSAPVQRNSKKEKEVFPPPNLINSAGAILIAFGNHFLVYSMALKPLM